MRTDWILKLIEDFAKALAAYRSGGPAEPVEEGIERLTGLSLARIDALPAWAIGNLMRVGDRRDERLAVVADALDELAKRGPVPLASSRMEKARLLRSLSEG